MAFIATLVAACAFALPSAHAAQTGIDTAVSFNGSSQSAVTSDTTTLGKFPNYTVEAWSRVAALPCSSTSNNGCVVVARDGDFGIKIFGSRYYFFGYSGSTTPGWIDSNVTARAGEWTHVALTRSGATLTFYVNGSQVATSTLGGALASTFDRSFRVGDIGYGSNLFNGQIDDVRLWSTTRTAAQIQTDMHTWGPASATGLVGYWDFNETAGATAYNQVPGAAASTNLTLAGSPTWPDVKSVARNGSKMVVTFPRSYLTRAGGWRVPGGVTSARTLVVAGGGGGGAGSVSSDNSGWQGGGGGAGGLLAAASTALTPGSVVRVAVGQGGAGAVPSYADENNPTIASTNGQDSVFGSVTAIGGGAALWRGRNGNSGGSGGGGGMYQGAGGAGTSGQGNAGGAAGIGTNIWGGGGGGGAGGAGGNAAYTGGQNYGGSAGPGVTSDITGTSRGYAGGGAGRGAQVNGTATGTATTAVATNAVANSGSGGGGGGDAASSGARSSGGSGGSGVVIVSYDAPAASVVGYDFNSLPSTVTAAGSSGRPLVSGGQLFLTTAAASEWGTAHFPIGATAAPSTWSISFYHQQAGGTGADGTVMWFAPTPGAYTSYQGLNWTTGQAYEDSAPTSGLSIQFDKYVSGRLAIFWNGTQVYSGTGYGTAFANGSNVTVSYDANGLDFSGFGLTLNNQTLANYATTVTSKDWQVSFGARTGGANDNHVIDNLSIRTNGPGVTMQDDRSRSFNGSTDYVAFPDHTVLDDATFTYEGWIKPTASTGALIRKEGSFALEIVSGVLHYASGSGTWDASPWTSTGLTIPMGVWTHVAFVQSGATVRIHLNGDPTGTVVSTTARTSYGNNTAPLLIGTAEVTCTTTATPCTGTRYEPYQGLMSDVRLWEVARTGTQIAATYATRLASDAVTFGFDEPAGSVAYNSAQATGSANNATVFGTTVSTDVPPIDEAAAVDGAGSVSAYLPAYTNSGSLTFAKTAATGGTATLSSAATGLFTYTPSNTGTYSDAFTYTVTDGTLTTAAQGVQAAVTDTTAPLSTGTAPATSTSATVSVGYTVTAGTADVASVAAFYSTASGLTSPTQCGTVTSTAASGTITCTLPSASGTYYLFTKATDGTGNVEAVPGSADATTALDLFVGVPTDASRVFNGTSDAVGILDANALDLSTFTFEAWVRPTASATEAMLVNKETSYELAIRSGDLQFALANTGGTWAWVSTGVAVPLNTWTHIAFVKNGVNVAVYINGSATASYTNASQPATLNNTTYPLAIGARAFSCTTLIATCGSANYISYFTGAMSDVRLWSTARTGAQIAATYNRRLASDLLTWFLDETSGTTAYNSAMVGGSALNGTYGGTTTSTDVPTMSAPTTFNVNDTASYSGYLPGYEPNGNVTFAVGTQGTKGTVSITSATGAFTYTPSAVNSTGLDSFTYTMSRGGVTSAAQTIGASITDVTAPTVSSFLSVQSSPTNAVSMTYTLTFSESVTGVAAGDFSNAGTSTGCVFDPGTDSGTTRTVTITGCSAGTIQPRFAINGASDLSSNTGPAAAATSSTTITRDVTAPTVSTFTSTAFSRTSATFSVSFSESVSGLVSAALSNTGTSTGWTGVVTSGSGVGPYVLTYTNSNAPAGTLIPTISTAPVDAAGNAFAGGSGPTMTVAAPTNSVVPTVSGNLKVAAVLTAADGTWTGDLAVTGTSYQWQVSADGSTGWTSATGTGNATASYTVAAADVWKYVRVQVTKTNSYGSTTAASAASVIQPAPLIISSNAASPGTQSVYYIGDGGLLSTHATRDTSVGNAPWFNAISPDGRTLYVANSGDNTVGMYRVSQTGSLTSLGTVATGTTPYGVAVSPNGKWVYVANSGASTISQYAVAADGTLTSIATAIANGAAPRELAVSRDSTALFVGNASAGSISRYTINQTTGALTSAGAATSISPGVPYTIMPSPVSDFLYVADQGQGRVHQYSIGANAALTALSPAYVSTTGTVHSAGLNATGTRLAVGGTTANQQMNTFSVNTTTGLLTQVGAYPFTSTATYPVFSPDSAYVYAALNGTVGQGAVAAGGAVSLLTPATVASGTTSHQLAMVQPKLAADSFAASGAATSRTPAFSLTFTRPVTGLGTDDFTVGGTASGVTVSSVSGSGAGPYTVTTGASGATTGTVILTVKANAVTDLASTTGPSTTTWPASTSATQNIDTTPPTVSSFSSSTADGSYKVGDSINITATTSEAVQSGNTLTATLDTGATVLLTAASAGTTLTGTYTVASGQSSADLTVSSFAIGTVADAYGNAMTATTVPSGSSNIAGAKAIVVDGVAPTVSSFSSSTADGTYRTGDTVNVTATTSEAIRSGNTLTVTLNTTPARTVLLTAASAGTTLTGTYTVQFNDTSSDLTVSSFSIGTVLDTVGNAMSSTTVPSGTSNIGGASAIVIDAAQPTVTITPSPSTVTPSTSRTSTVTFTLSDASTDFTAADVTVTNGRLSGFSGSGTSYTATFTATGVGPTATISVAAGSFTKANGSSNVSGSGSVTIAATNGRTAFTGNGTIGTSGTVYVVERFTSGTTTWTVPRGVTTVDYLVIAGGGGGGSRHAGGGGAGGLRSSVAPTGGGASAPSPLTVTPGQTLTATVGAGGAGSAGGSSGTSGSDSSLSGSGITTVTATGGGGGAGGAGSGFSGGSGGGANYNIANYGSGATGQGFAGGNGVAGTLEGGWAGGGGGGAGGVGGTATQAVTNDSVPGNGGAGVLNAISGVSTCYAGGGGGGHHDTASAAESTGGGCGGTLVGGRGGKGRAAGTGVANTGSGGGAGGFSSSTSFAGGAGATGLIVVRYALPSVTTPDLDAASDSGASSTDDITSNTTPTITGYAPPGASVQLKDSGTDTGSTCLANDTTGAWSCTTGTLSAGAHSLTAVASTALDTVVTSTSSALSVTVDTTAPTASFSAVTSTPTGALNVVYTLTFSEAVTGVTAADFSTTGTATGCTFSPGTDSGTTRTVAISGCSDGTVIPVFASGGATDAASNTGPATAVTGSTITIARNATPTLGTPATATFTDTTGVDTFSNATGTLNGADADVADTLTYSITGGTDGGTTVAKTGSYGTLTVTKATGAYVFAPNASAINALAANTSETFTVTVSDGTASASATYTVSITAVNDVPVITAPSPSLTDTAAADSFSAQTGTLTATDAESNAISSWAITGGTTGSWSLNWSSGSVTFNRRLVGTYGTLYLESTTGKYRFEPNATAVDGLTAAGSENLPVTATDSASGVGSASIAVSVTGVNDTPTLGAVTAASYTDTAANDSFSNDTGTLSGADRDTGATLSYGITGGTAASGSVTKVGTYGSLTVNQTTGAYTYTPSVSAINALAANASDTFTVTVSDGSLSASQTYTVSLTAANDTPTLAAVTAAAYTDTAANDSFSNDTGTLSGADRDTGATLSYGITGGTDASGSVTKVGTYGLLTVNQTTGAYTYTPSASAINALTANASDTFTMTVSDGSLSASQTYTVSVTAANDTPTLAAVTAASYTDTAANDSFSNDAGTLAGADRDTGATLSYGITGGTAASGSVTKAGTYGLLTVNQTTGAYTYTPTASAINALTSNASDTFTMTVSDGSLSASQTYTVSLTAANDTPTLATPTTAAFTDTAGNDAFSDATGTLAGADRDSGTTLTYGITGGTDGGTTVSLVGTYGTLTVTKATGAYTYAPAASAINARTANASDTFTVTVSDGALSTAATFTASITAANDTPTLAAVAGPSYSDTALNDTFGSDSGTLAGADRDAGATLTYGISGGSASAGAVTKVGTYGTLVVTQATGAYTYTPSASSINALSAGATDSFTVTVSDGTATVTTAYLVSITAVNDTPTLAVPTAASFTDTSGNDSFSNATGTLAGADRDAGATLTYGITGGTDGGTTVSLVGTYGTLTVTKATGAYTFAPNATAINARSVDGAESFTVTVSDGTAATTQTYTASITAANDTPTLAAVTGATFTDTAANDSFSSDSGTLAGADRDTGATLAYGITGGTSSGGITTKVGTYGSLSVNETTGAYTYTPVVSAINARTANASDTFTVTVSDGTASASATYTASITAANDTPTLAAVTGATFTDTAANDAFSNDTGTLSGADRDTGATLAYGITGGTSSGGITTKVGTYGSLSVNETTGAYTYTPSASAINARTADATDTFTVTVSDGTASASRTYTATIVAANDTPTLAAVTGASYPDTIGNDAFTADSGTLAGTDRDAGATLTYGISGGTDGGTTVSRVGTYGTLTVTKSSGAYTYTPSSSAINARTTDASDTFTMTVSDGTESATQAYVVSVVGANDAPTLSTPSTATFTDTAVDDAFGDIGGTLAGADRDTGATLTYGITGGTDGGTTVSLVGTYGTLTVTKATGAYTFAPNATAINARATSTLETMSVTVSDGTLTTSATFTISVSGANDTPTLAAVTGGTYADTAVNDTFSSDSGTLVGADRDTGATLSYGISGGTDNGATVSKVGTYGTLTVTKATGAYAYAPSASAINGITVDSSDGFTMTVSDGSASASRSYTVVLTAANDTPTLAAPTGPSYADTAANDTFASDTGTLAGADRDAGTTLTYGITGGSASGGVVSRAGTYGTLTVNQSTGAYTYTPSAAVINARTADATDSFTVTVSDGIASVLQPYTVSITAANDTPTLATPAAASFADTAANDSFSNDTGTLAGADRDAGATLAYGITGGTSSGGVTTKAGTYGTLSVNETTGAYVYAPNASAINARTANASDTFTVSVSDGTASATVTYTASVVAANDTPTLAAVTGASYTDTAANDTFSNDTGTLAGADRDTGATLTYGITGGTAASGVVTKAGTYGSLAVNQATGAYTYTPTASAINARTADASDTFTMTVSDGSASASQTYTVSIVAANDTPTLAAVTGATYTDTAANDSFTADSGTLAGADRDAGATLTYGISGGTDGGTTVSRVGAYGTLTVTKASGAYTYTPSASAINARTADTTDTFTITVSDGTASASQVYTVSIIGANDAPTLGAVTGPAYTDTAANDAFADATGVLSGVDGDAGTTLTYGISGGTDGGATVSKVGTYGTLTVTKSTGAYTYSPSASAINARVADATDSFTVTVSDGLATASQPFAASITGANDTPVVVAPAAAAYVDTAADDTFADTTGTLVASDRDAGQTISYSVVGGTSAAGRSSKAGTYGTLSIDQANGAYTYAPSAVAINALTTTASESLTLRVSDGTATADAAFAMSATGANDTPTLVAPTAQSFTDTPANDIFTTRTGILGGADRDTGATLSYGVTGGVDDGTTVTATGTYGVLVVTKATGAWTYTPNRVAMNRRTANATEDFAVTVGDGTATATRTLGTQLTGSAETPVVTWSNPADLYYPAPLDATSHLNATVADASTGAAVDGVLAYSRGGQALAAGAVLEAGTHTLHVEFTPTGSTANDYVATSANVTLVVRSAVQTIAVVAPSTREYGDAVTTLAASGYTGTGTITYSVVAGPCSITGTQLQTTGVGNCDVSASIAADANHTAAQSPTFRIAITQALLTVTADAKGKRVATADPALTYQVTGFQRGDTAAVITTPIQIARAAGEAVGTYTITPSGAAAANYAFAYVPAAFTIYDRDVPTLAWAQPAAIGYGTVLSGAQLAATATFSSAPVAGSFTYSEGGTPIAAGMLLPAGDHILTATFTPTDTVAYASGTTTQVTLTVQRRALTVTGITAAGKDYDGQRAAALQTASAALVGIIGADAVQLDVSQASGLFDAADPGEGRTVTVSGLALTGAAQANYSLVQPTATATIRAVVPGAPTSASATAGDRQATVTWAAPAFTGGAAITGYTVTATPGGQTCSWTGGPLACTVTGLDNGGSYTFEVRAVNSVGAGPASTPTAAVVPAASVEAIDPGATSVLPNGSAAVQIGCAASARACSATVTLMIGTQSIATATQKIAAGQTDDVAVALPIKLQRKLAAEGTLQVKAVTIIDIDGSKVRVESTITLEAPPAEALMRPTIKLAADGSAIVTGACAGTAVTRCDGTLVLYADASTIAARAGRADDRVAVGLTRLAGPSGASVTARTSLTAAGKALLRKHGSIHVTPILTFKGSTRLGGDLPSFTMTQLSEAEWLRRVMAALRTGGNVRVELNNLVDRARRNAINRGVAANRIEHHIIPAREQARARAAALPVPPARLQPIATLLLRAFDQSLLANHAYVEWLRSGQAEDTKGWRISLRASATKARLITLLDAACSRHGIRVPSATNFWP